MCIKVGVRLGEFLAQDFPQITLLSPVGPLHVPLDGAVDLNVCACDVGVLVGDEEGDDGGHVLHLAAPPRRDALLDQVAVVLQPEMKR